MSRKKVSTTIYITPEQADELRLLHERSKVPIAVYIREGIDLVLKHYAHLLPGQLALTDQGAPSSRASGSFSGDRSSSEPGQRDSSPGMFDSVPPPPPPPSRGKGS